MPKTCNVLLVRHGERLDEADFREWIKVLTNDTQHDPPLTERGRLQAKGAGEIIKDMLDETGNVKLYASPSVRTLATAAELGEVLGIQEMRIAPGLFACAAAARRIGVPNLMLANPGSARFSEATRDKVLPHSKHVGALTDSFDDALDRIVGKTPHGHTAIVVTHREGIGYHNYKFGRRVATSYCCTVRYTCTHDDEKKASWKMVSVATPDVKKG
eukprot:TRINITY_DN11121_c0_g2_i2.p1 TRINITY_DN11121_c0_g2~~TRINITY_DN11121_c0_g2_i2.p1  ORF type:complete len:222 (+),score=55.39 TRINITY_DN11121_c0_g2_i2:23-667(+)